jgi:hypothetical protein
MKTFSIGEYNASANEIIMTKMMKSNKFIPKNMGIGAVVDIAHPTNMRSYES